MHECKVSLNESSAEF